MTPELRVARDVSARCDEREVRVRYYKFRCPRDARFRSSVFAAVESVE